MYAFKMENLCQKGSKCRDNVEIGLDCKMIFLHLKGENTKSCSYYDGGWGNETWHRPTELARHKRPKQSQTGVLTLPPEPQLDWLGTDDRLLSTRGSPLFPILPRPFLTNSNINITAISIKCQCLCQRPTLLSPRHARLPLALRTGQG